MKILHVGGIPLSLEDNGTPHSLCPVGALRRYLNLTKDFQDGPLFLHPTFCKPLSKPQVSVRLCSLIKESQPGSFPRPHDVRKSATSLAFFHSISIEAICNNVGWASAQVFKRTYLRNVQGITRTCVILGNIISP